jgi:hypothetical protein
MKDDGNPMHPAQRLFLAPRCTGKTKRTGLPCQAPAVRGWSVCRMHGAHGGAPSGPGNGMWRHGGRSAETIGIRRLGAALTRMARDTCSDL